MQLLKQQNINKITDMELTLEQVEEIFENTESKWNGDNAIKGLLIIGKHYDLEKESVLVGANHDIIYSIDIDEALERLSEGDFIDLAKLNWMLDSESDCLSCFV